MHCLREVRTQLNVAVQVASDRGEWRIGPMKNRVALLVWLFLLTEMRAQSRAPGEKC
jgi:hypothetical protein